MFGLAVYLFSTLDGPIRSASVALLIAVDVTCSVIVVTADMATDRIYNGQWFL